MNILQTIAMGPWEIEYAHSNGMLLIVSHWVVTGIATIAAIALVLPLL